MVMKKKAQGWAKALHSRYDDWQNILTGIGMAGRDKRMGTSFSAVSLSRQEVEEIWRGDDMGARVVEIIPKEMLRQGYCVDIKDNKDAANALVKKAEAIDLDSTIKTALNYERSYGGGGIVLGVDDGQKDLSKPLQKDRIKSVKWVNAMAAHELFPMMYYDDPREGKYGQPKIYRMQPELGTGGTDTSDLYIHESRIIKFQGIVVSKTQLRNNNGWGDSVLNRCNRVLSDFHQSWGSAAILLQDFSQAVLKVEGLAELIAGDQDDVVVKRATLLDMQRSVARMIMIDSTEDFERKMTPMTGLAEMLQQFSLRLAAAAELPVSLLMGQAPAGLNATGASDIRFFYDKTKSDQNTKLKGPLSFVYELMMLAKDGPTRGRLPDVWSINFNPLWQLTDLEQAEVRLKTSQADQIDITVHVLTPQEVTNSRYGGDRYSTATVVDMASRGEFFSDTDPLDAAGDEDEEVGDDV